MDCIDELHWFAQERLAYYQALDKEVDEFELNNPIYITKKTVEALLPSYLVREYDSFCVYLTDLVRCAESDLDKMRKELKSSAKT